MRVSISKKVNDALIFCSVLDAVEWKFVRVPRCPGAGWKQ